MGKYRQNLQGQAKTKSPLQGQAGEVSQTPLYLCFNFSRFDSTQGQTFENWHENGLLLKALHRWKEQCKKTVRQCEQEKGFAIYGSLPSHSEFYHPSHVPEDAQWASMHLQGAPCVIGHVVGNVFYVVFFDEYHKFWPTPKKHT